MKVRKPDPFQLTENTINKVKYIKLNKKASYLEKELDDTIYNKGIGNRSTSISFYSFGFYDSLSCVKTNEITSLSYQEHFLISYPFEKTANTSKVEQWFGILPLAEERRYSSETILDTIEDPFFCREELQKELPFIGVILISLSNMNAMEVHFKKLLTDYVEKIASIFEEIDKEAMKKRYIAEIYYSLNCSDLCLAIRTDEIPLVHHVNHNMRARAERSCYGINTTVIFAVQDNADENMLEHLADKNKKVSFIVRSNDKFNEKSYGVNGIGRYVTTFNYENYIKFLPQIFLYKLGKKNGSTTQIEEYVKGICHEREWFVEEGQAASPALANDEDGLQKAICEWIRNIHRKVIEIEQLALDIFSGSKELYGYEEIFTREMRLVKDLIYSYSDLWYQSASDSGFIFFAQLEAVLHGLRSLLKEIKTGSNGDVLETSIEYLFKVIHCSVCDLNGYNKQFQFLNQDSVNFPNYEIQSKVNAEKYIAAYSSFLHKFFVLYYQNKPDSKHIVQNFPLALVDLNERKITANIFFSQLYKKNTKKENEKVRGIFAVHFPSSEYFSNVWNSIPLLMHEASHSQNYGETYDRNKALVYNIDMHITEILTEKMLECANDGIAVYTSSFLGEVLKEQVYKAIAATRESFFDKIGDFENWKFEELLENCEEYYSSILGKHYDRKNITYNQIKTLRKRIKKDIDHIMEVVGLEAMWFAYSRDKVCPSAIYYFVNVLYLELYPKFYLEFKDKYDNDFLKDLLGEIGKEGQEEVEKVLVVYALYRFLRYVKHDEAKISEHPEIMEANNSDSLVIAFMMLLIVGMRALYEKYRKGFIVEVSEKEYYDALIPDSANFNVSEYAKQLEHAYDNLGKKGEYDGGNAYGHDANLMRTMLYEYYELYVCVNNVLHFLVENELSAEDDSAADNGDMFIERMHDECIKYIRGEENTDSLGIVFAMTNRELLVKLGFFEKGSSILKKVYAGICAESSDSFVKDVVNNRRQLFMEVYADCGMCCAMGFDPFGYCIFAMSIYKTVNDLESMNPNSNFLTDRICSVVRMFFSDSDKADWGHIFATFLGKLCDVEMIESICRMLLSNGENEEITEICNGLSTYREEKFECDIDELPRLLRAKYTDVLTDWKDDILGRLIDILEKCNSTIKDIKKSDKISVAKTYLMRIYDVLLLVLQDEMLSHILNDNFNGFFQGVRKYIEANEGIKAVKNDKCVKEISRFYNMNYAEETEDKFEWYYNTYCGGFLTQCNFIFENYCDYRNAYDGLKSQIKANAAGGVVLEIDQWFEKIDDYYREVK